MPNQNVQAPPATTAQLRAAFTATPIDRNALKNAVCAYVDAMKTLGASIERIIVDIKRLAEVEGGPVHRAEASKGSGHKPDGRKLVEEAVSWAIQHYY